MLSGFAEIPVCVGYEIDGKVHTELPMTQTEFHHAKPVYEILQGWKTDITAARSFSDLPKAAQDYVKFLEAQSGAPISAIGVGQERYATIVMRDLSK